ncbi:hypothetical protein D779_1703 [Imhoffiella purpurea]|uniref:Uncharacterized protein n=1 Tax=Imhoffiella purpurea TaxID=1249627 RepID=W9V6W3_9GAMM|nr:hypothetical protein D779_1703 [Imhoffiella purpurea]
MQKAKGMKPKRGTRGREPIPNIETGWARTAQPDENQRP